MPEETVVSRFPSSADVRSIIATIKEENGTSLMEAIILYAETNGIEIEAMASVIQGSMRTELEQEARVLNLLKSSDNDTRSGKKSPSGGKAALHTE